MFLQMLTFLGIGKVPLLLLTQMLCFTWGTFGYIANQILQVSQRPDTRIWPSLALSLVSSVLVTRSGARLLGRLMPTKGTQVVRKRDLAGRMGEVLYTVTESSGLVHVHDDFGTSHQVACRVRPGDDPIPRGREVVLLGYDRKGDWYWVDEWREEAETRRMMEALDDLAESVQADA
jgi:membrane protein implicated in regulation of membrane protease activity